MKFNRHTYILLFAVSCFMLTACSDEIMNLTEGEVGEFTSPADDDEMVDVTFKLSIDPSMIAKTRANDGRGTTDGQESTEDVKSDLEDLDLFIYAIRDENNNILYQYGKGIVDEDLQNEPAFKNYSLQDDNNQTLMRVTWTREDGNNNGESSGTEGGIENGRYKMEELTLRVKRNTVFQFSCWAQSSQSTAYDFNYLTALKVDYSEMSANSEINDAFCATSIFSIGLRDATVSITLRRPFAQINVGIDEETLKEENNRNVSFGTASGEYKYSKVKLNGLATAFDVVKNKVWTPENIRLYSLCKKNKTDGKEKEDYDEDDILADSLYGNYSENLFDDAIIKDPTKVISEFELPYSLMPGLKKESGSTTVTGELDKLTVFDFSNWNNNTGVPKKTFRKLAMAYVLVPDFESDDTDTSDESTIELESFYVAKDINDSEGNKVGDSEIIYTPKDEKDPEKPSLSISVKRNWRTNLLFTNWDWLGSKGTTSGN